MLSSSSDATKVRARVVVFFFTVAFLLLAARLYVVQIGRHEELYAKARSQYTAVRTTTGRRGEIFDVYGNLLVGNAPCDTISVDPQIAGSDLQRRRMAAMFARHLHLDYDEVYARLTRSTRQVTLPDGTIEERPIRYVVIAREVPPAKSIELRRLIRANRFTGIFFREHYMRYYPKKSLLANILGFTNVDHDKTVAVLGIEKFFNEEMASSESVQKFERARDGRRLPYGDQKDIRGRHGFNIFLTISEPLQSIFEEELDNLVEKWRPKAAYAVVIDPRNGDILAIAQRPTFNPNDRSSMDPQSWRVRLIEDVLEPGSTMKPFAVAGALDYGLVSPETRFDCENGLWFYGGRSLKDSRPLPVLTVREIIQKSSNIGTAKIALEMGVLRLNRILRKFGFGSFTGIPLQPESRGIFRTPDRWDTLSITRFPIGQGIAVTPLQLARAYCALADNGRLRKIRLVDRIEDPDSGLVFRNPAEPPIDVFHRPDTWNKIVEMMCLVTESGGTATQAAIPGYQVAGKTGTSQKWVDGAYSRSQYIASFVGFVPARQPRLVILVAADEPKGSYYGGTVAGPAFSAIGLRALRYLDIKPDKQMKNEE